MRKICTVLLAFALSIPTTIGSTAASADPRESVSAAHSLQTSVKPNPHLAPSPSPTATPLAKPRFTLSTSKAVLSTSTSTSVASARSTGGQIRSFSVSPKLPSGLRLNTSSGEISGKPRFWQKAKKYKVIARNASGVSSQSISIQVIRIPILKLGVLDLGVNQRMKAFGLKNIGGAATTYSISPELPVGLSFNTANGKITGRPTELQPKRNYKISATNISGTSTKKLTIEIVSKPIVKLSKSDFLVSPNRAFSSYTIKSTGGRVYKYSIRPAAPAGMSINSKTGKLVGTPTTPQNKKTYTIIATNPAGVSKRNINLEILAPPSFTLGITGTNSDAILGTNVSFNTQWLYSDGGQMSEVIISPALPAGLAFDASTFTLSGTANASLVKTNYSLTGKNIAGLLTKTFSLEVLDSPKLEMTPKNPIGFSTSGDLEKLAVGSEVSGFTVSNSGGRVTSWSVSPALPDGIVLNQLSGEISGAAELEVESNQVYTFTGTNPGGSSSFNYRIKLFVPPSFQISSSSENIAVGDSLVGFTLESVGGLIENFSISDNAPSWLIFDTATGLMTGVASAVQSLVTLTIYATNVAGTSSKTFTLEAFSVPSFSLSTSNESAVNGQAIAGYTISSTGGRITNYTVSPALPEGITLNSESGLITGSSNLDQSPTTYTITGTNVAGSDSHTFELAVYSAPSISLSSTGEQAVKGSFISGYTISQSGGTPTSYQISPAAPAGLTFDVNTGILSGKPTNAQSDTTYTISAVNVAGTNSQSFSLEVFSAPSFSLSKSNVSVANGLPVGVTTIITGGRITNYSVSPALPDGVFLDDETGAIFGFPFVDLAPTTYTITGTNVAGSYSRTLQLAVYSAPQISLSSASEQAVKGASISGYTISQSGGTPTSYQISPAAPAGLTFNVNTGILSGKPTNAQSSTTYTISAINVAGTSQATFRLEVIAAPIFTLSKISESVVVNTSVTGYAISSTGGPVLGYSITPQLPSGLSFDASTGLLSGTPVADQSPTTYTITGVNIAGSDSHTFSIGVYSAPSISLSSTSETAIKGNALVGYSLTQLGGTPTSYQITPAAPAGLTFNTTTGLLTGTPTSPQSEVIYTIKGSNVAGNSEATFALTIIDPPVFSLSQSNVVAYLQETSSLYSITSTGGAITSFEITPALPAGLTYSTVTGLISGTPTELTSTTEHTITATNPVGTMTKTFNLEVRLTCASGGICVVGDIGPGGGKVVYADQAGFLCGPSYTETCHYLEAAPKNWFGGTSDPALILYGSGQGTAGRDALITTDSISMGRGEYNNYAVVDSVGTYATNPCAVTAALDYVTTYKGVQIGDWYLPDQKEMEAVKDSYIAGKLAGDWNLNSSTRYWLSNQYWGVHTNYGDARYEPTVGLDGLSSRNIPATTLLPVRPVRSF